MAAVPNGDPHKYPLTACAGGVAWLSASEGGNIPLTVDPSFTGAAVKPSVKEMDTMPWKCDMCGYINFPTTFQCMNGCREYRPIPKWVEAAKAGKLPVKVEQKVYPRGGDQ